MARFEVKRRDGDKKFNKWEKKWASELGILEAEDGSLRDHKGELRDYLVWVITGVFNSRGQAYREAKQ